MPGKRYEWIAAAIYLVLLAGLGVGLFVARQYALRNFATDTAQQAWEAWRQEAKRQDGVSNPVDRRPPASAEPPTLVLLRDHFGTICAGAFFITSALYWTLVLMIRGALFAPQYQIDTGMDPMAPKP